jgi:7-cyano-7-deazaguanine synthase
MNRQIRVSLSGGMDSATLLGQARSVTRDVYCVGFTYGSKHNQYENQAARDLASYYSVPLEFIDLSRIFSGYTSALMKDGGAIPEGHYTDATMSQTVVPGRNLIFASILASMAEHGKYTEVWMGMHSGDHAIYPDCRPSFAFHAREAIHESTEGKVKLMTPFMDITKSDILQLGYEVGVPYAMTRTCYLDDAVACGRCGSCQERLEAFSLIQREDPIQYKSRELLPKSK